MTIHTDNKETLQNALKRIEELEKENTELKEINEGYNRNRDKLIAMGFPTFKSCKEYSDKLTNLQKENTELEEKLRIATEYPEWSKTVKLAEKDCIKRLAEAREIIKGLLSCARNYPEGNLEKMQKAEKFLKEIEK